MMKLVANTGKQWRLSLSYVLVTWPATAIAASRQKNTATSVQPRFQTKTAVIGCRKLSKTVCYCFALEFVSAVLPNLLQLATHLDWIF